MAQENKTEKATPYRRRKLREEGNVAKSPELASSITVFLSSIVLFFTGAYLFYEVVNLIRLIIENPYVNYFSVFSLLSQSFPRMLLPFFLIAVLTVILVHIGQFGFIFTLKPLQFKWERLNPFEGLKKIFSLTTLFELTKNTLKVSLFIIVSYFLIKGGIEHLLTAPSEDALSFALYLLKLIFKIVITLSVFAILISILDYGYKRWDYERRIRMSKEEVKEEYKQHEGEGNYNLVGRHGWSAKGLSKEREDYNYPYKGGGHYEYGGSKGKDGKEYEEPYGRIKLPCANSQIYIWNDLL